MGYPVLQCIRVEGLLEGYSLGEPQDGIVTEAAGQGQIDEDFEVDNVLDGG